MPITLNQEDFYCATSIVCALLLYLVIITSKGLDQDLRKPWIAVMVAMLAGIVIWISKAIPVLVIGILCSGFLIVIVRNISQLHKLSHQIVSPEIPSQEKQSASISIEFLKSFWPMMSVVLVMGFFGLIYTMFDKDGLAGVIGSIHSTSSVSVITQPITSAPLTTTQTTKITDKTEKVAKIDEQLQAALHAYQRAKTDHQASIQAVDTEWVHLSKSTSKSNLDSWHKSQQSWSIAKRHVCGLTDVSRSGNRSSTELNVAIKALRCDTAANLNRANYIKKSANAMIKGHKPTDDLGSLIQNLSNH